VDPQLATVLTAFASVLVALGVLIREVRQYHHVVNSRMDELLELTAKSSLAEGKLAGPDVESGISPQGLIGDSPPSTRWRRGHN